jgi:hypothetical protein
MLLQQHTILCRGCYSNYDGDSVKLSHAADGVVVAQPDQAHSAPVGESGWEWLAAAGCHTGVVGVVAEDAAIARGTIDSRPSRRLYQHYRSCLFTASKK